MAGSRVPLPPRPPTFHQRTAAPQTSSADEASTSLTPRSRSDRRDGGGGQNPARNWLNRETAMTAVSRAPDSFYQAEFVVQLRNYYEY